MDAPSILFHLCEIFLTCIRYEKHKMSKALCKMVEEDQVGHHVVKMIDYIERLVSLSLVMDNDLVINIVL